MRIPVLLLAAILSIPTQVLILKSGARLSVDGGSVSEHDGRVIFRSGGALYSLSSNEVDFDATRAAASVAEVRPGSDKARIKVSDAEKQRLLRELEQNHRGSPAALPHVELPRDPAADQTPAEKSSSEEWSWRRQARAHEEEIRQAKEALQLLQDKAERLRSEITSFLSLGYKPSQFTYQTGELQYTLDAMPQAELTVQRAERSYSEFRDDARRLGVLPGWLR
jgi:hypothetical protein